VAARPRVERIEMMVTTVNNSTRVKAGFFVEDGFIKKCSGGRFP
jgi:hypothetical protein